MYLYFSPLTYISYLWIHLNWEASYCQKCVMNFVSRKKINKSRDLRQMFVNGLWLDILCIISLVFLYLYWWTVIVSLISWCQQKFFSEFSLQPIFAKDYDKSEGKKSRNYTLIFAKKWRKLPPLNVYLIEKKSRVSTRILCVKWKSSVLCFESNKNHPTKLIFITFSLNHQVLNLLCSSSFNFGSKNKTGLKLVSW